MQYIKTVNLSNKVRLAIALGKSLLKNGQWVRNTKTGERGRLVIKRRFKALPLPLVATIVKYRVTKSMDDNNNIFVRALNHVRKAV